jgi:hypothetical protein
VVLVGGDMTFSSDFWHIIISVFVMRFAETTWSTVVGSVRNLGDSPNGDETPCSVAAVSRSTRV